MDNLNSTRSMIYQKHFVESLNINSGKHFSGFQWRYHAESIDIDTIAEMGDTHFNVGDIVEISVSRFEDKGNYYTTLGTVIEEPESCHGEYLVLYGPFDVSFRYADFMDPISVHRPSGLISDETKESLTEYFKQYQAYCHILLTEKSKLESLKEG